MITLFCDLDNTIIYSHRKKLNTPKRVAEMLNGVEQSYITERTFDYLKSCQSISFIPVTTRTLQQYERVKRTIESFNCKYALILNGAVLLNNGIVDETWLNETRELVKESAKEMSRAVELLIREKTVSLKYHDNFLTYGSTSSPEKVSKRINDYVDQSLVHSFFDSRKVYCAPAILTKGNAVGRLSSQLKPEFSLAVGDSENDLSMFGHVDVPIVPNVLAARVQNPNKVIVSKDQILSDATCEVIERVIDNSSK